MPAGLESRSAWRPSAEFSMKRCWRRQLSLRTTTRGLRLLTATGGVAGLALLTWPASQPARLVEDRVSGPRALHLEEAVGPGDHQDAVPQASGVLAARDRRDHRSE